MFVSCYDFMWVILKMQIKWTVKDFASQPIPFANGDLVRVDEFERLYGRLVEFASNTTMPVLHKFSLAAREVRSVGTSERRAVI